jgi:hypothetical protein
MWKKSASCVYFLQSRLSPFARHTCSHLSVHLVDSITLSSATATLFIRSSMYLLRHNLELFCTNFSLKVHSRSANFRSVAYGMAWHIWQSCNNTPLDSNIVSAPPRSPDKMHTHHPKRDRAPRLTLSPHLDHGSSRMDSSSESQLHHQHPNRD